jgi:hypothetical protein
MDRWAYNCHITSYSLISAVILVVGDVADVSEVLATSTFRVEVYKLVSYCFEKGDIYIYTKQFTNLQTSTLKKEAAYTSETPATSPTAKQCNKPRTE